jgi:hypothetical protein
MSFQGLSSIPDDQQYIRAAPRNYNKLLCYVKHNQTSRPNSAGTESSACPDTQRIQQNCNDRRCDFQTAAQTPLRSGGWPRSHLNSHVSQKRRNMGHPHHPMTDKGKRSNHAAGGRILITIISVSLIRTGPTSPHRYQRKLFQRQCSGEVTNPRFTGLRCM